jgi:Ran GTPase-activating protein 1
MATTEEKKFSLLNKSLKLHTAADIDEHLGPLKSSDNITHITLVGNTLGVEASQALAPFLAKQKSLVDINLADIFTSRGLSEIPPALDALLTALLDCPNLETVNLSDNAFGLNTVEPLVKFLRQHVPLRHLILNNNGLGPQAGSLIANALSELAGRKSEARKSGKQVPDLETIVCGRNRLETGSMAAWAKAYQVLPGIRTVKMVQNGIRPEGIVTLLSEGLSHSKNLELLDLQDNTFTADGARALAKIVPTLTLLQELGVGDCLLKPRGALILAQALGQGKNHKLKTFRSQFAELDRKGLKALVAAVDSGALPALQRVELNGNIFSEDEEQVVHLREVLDERREEIGAEDDDTWGIDDLEDMEDDSDEEDEGEDEEGEKESEDVDKTAEKILRDADLAENENVSQKKDTDVDALADALGKKL